MGTQIPPLDIKDGKACQVEQLLRHKLHKLLHKLLAKPNNKLCLNNNYRPSDPVVQQQQAELQVKQAKLNKETMILREMLR